MLALDVDENLATKDREQCALSQEYMVERPGTGAGNAQ